MEKKGSAGIFIGGAIAIIVILVILYFLGIDLIGGILGTIRNINIVG